MKIFFDTTPLHNGHAGRGIGVYTENLIAALKKNPSTGVFQGPIKAGGFECDLIHYPFFDFFFHTLPFINPTKVVVTIHDTIPLIYQDVVKPGIRGRLKHLLQRLALKGVSAVITDSQNSKNDIVRHLGVPQHKIFAIPLAVDEKFVQFSQIKPKPSALPPLPDKYILYVGDINYSKNLPQLIKAFSDSTYDGDLVIVSRAMGGNRQIPESRAIITEISHSSKKGRVHLLTDCGPDLLPAIYQKAHYYIQPSLYEGFGLPLLEAFYARIPVACANTSSLPEVAGDAAVYFDPRNLSSIIQILNSLTLQSSADRQEQISKGTAQLETFSWTQTARATMDVYRKVLGL